MIIQIQGFIHFGYYVDVTQDFCCATCCKICKYVQQKFLQKLAQQNSAAVASHDTTQNRELAEDACIRLSQDGPTHLYKVVVAMP